MNSINKRKSTASQDVHSSKRTRKIIEVASNGTISIQVGTGEAAIDIRVSATVLKLASRVFARMLESNFCEAYTKTIDLKNDDSKAVLDFFKVLHYDFSCMEHWDGRQMALIAEMAAMRCCTHVFAPHIVPKLSKVTKKMAIAAKNPIDNDRMSTFLSRRG